MSPAETGLQRVKPQPAPVTWWLHHQEALSATLERLRADWPGTALVALTLGITLALPTLLWVAATNLSELTAGWDRTPRINVFVAPSADARAVLERLRANEEVAAVDWQPPEASLQEFARASGFDATLAEGMEALGAEPLPGVALVTPAEAVRAPARLKALAARLDGSPGIEGVQLDLEWVVRLQATLATVDRLTWALAGLLAVAALLVVGSLTRMALEQRREEILVLRLVGGTDAFVRRPFLYGGVLQGAAGGLAAWLLVMLAVAMVAGPVSDLARSYGSGFRIDVPAPGVALVLVSGGGLLGWLGARIAAGRGLAAIEP